MRGAIAGPDHLAVEGLVAFGHRGRSRERPAVGWFLVYFAVRLAQFRREPADHLDRGRPGAIGRENGLDHLLKDGLATHHPAISGRHPREHGIARCQLVEGAQVLIEPEDMPDFVPDHGPIDIGGAQHLHRDRTRFALSQADCPDRAIW